MFRSLGDARRPGGCGRRIDSQAHGQGREQGKETNLVPKHQKGFTSTVWTAIWSSAASTVAAEPEAGQKK